MVSPVRKYDYMASLDAQIYAPPYRASLTRYAPNTKEYWFEKAACRSLPAENFEPVFDGGVDGVKTKEDVIRENEAKFEQARKACDSCPVWHLCYQKALGDDFFYTMRAGIEPVQFTRYKATGRVPWRSGQELDDKDTCIRGHGNWKVWGKKRPRRKCLDCDKMSPQEKVDFDLANGVD